MTAADFENAMYAGTAPGSSVMPAGTAPARGTSRRGALPLGLVFALALAPAFPLAGNGGRSRPAEAGPRAPPDEAGADAIAAGSDGCAATFGEWGACSGDDVRFVPPFERLSACAWICTSTATARAYALRRDARSSPESAAHEPDETMGLLAGQAVASLVEWSSASSAPSVFRVINTAPRFS